jgi:hypothetical protein
MSEIDEYIYGHEGSARKIMLYLHDLMCSYPNIRAKISYKVPFYYGKSWICYLNPLKNGAVEMAFPRGYELSNVQGLLDSKGRKMVKGIEFRALKEIPEDSLREIINEAIILDDTVPYTFKK